MQSTKSDLPLRQAPVGRASARLGRRSRAEARPTAPPGRRGPKFSPTIRPRGRIWNRMSSRTGVTRAMRVLPAPVPGPLGAPWAAGAPPPRRPATRIMSTQHEHCSTRASRPMRPGEDAPRPPPGDDGRARRAGAGRWLDLKDLPLTDQDGRELRFVSDVIGDRVVVMDFVYTTCTTVCPVLSALFARSRSGSATAWGIRCLWCR